MAFSLLHNYMDFIYLMIHFSYNKLELPLLCETKAECLNKHN